ncbi:epoxide hydrolase [Catellatospora sp. TT07R-123]|uniref:alpha/beta fold hydrolase n=1 Tax=Catellatospora sp. TT07R-123 TaxID=2733863 RepID=UPI001B2DA6E2|nr:alpha/beta hydrolase [Catellatospora sp. TT07R-123]GHJ47753.1 epoxide hydrolase [Catellatospora sp. TT07R-123]
MRVHARGLEFDVSVSGPDDGRPVLLLHGFPQHAGEWDAVAARLAAAGMRTYALDQRGYSPGARPTEVESYRVDELVADALAVLDELGVAWADVVGHDWGAVVAWYLAARHPGRVRTLTAVSVPHPAAYLAALAADPDQQGRSAYIQLFQQAGVAEEVLLGDDAQRLRAVFTGCPPESVESYVAPMREPGALTAALNWYRAGDFHDMGRLGPVSVPTTFVWSDGDLAVGRVAAENCPEHVTGDYRFVAVPGVSHWIPDEAPDAVADAILARTAA